MIPLVATTAYACAKSPGCGNSSHRHRNSPAVRSDGGASRAAILRADMASKLGFDGQVVPPAEDVIDAGVGASRPIGDTRLRTYDRWLAIEQVIDAKQHADVRRELIAGRQIEQVVLPGGLDGGVRLRRLYRVLDGRQVRPLQLDGGRPDRVAQARQGTVAEVRRSGGATGAGELDDGGAGSGLLLEGHQPCSGDIESQGARQVVAEHVGKPRPPVEGVVQAAGLQSSQVAVQRS